MVLLVRLDEGHSLYRAVNGNTTETLRIFWCIVAFLEIYIYYCVDCIWEIYYCLLVSEGIYLLVVFIWPG